MEIWMSLKDFPGYSVSNLGNVRNEKRGTEVKIVRMKSGHSYVGLSINGVQVKRLRSRLVAETFVENPDPILFNTPIHLNGDLFDCHDDNLAWRPRWFAIRYAQQFARQTPKHLPVIRKTTGIVYEVCWPIVTSLGVLYRDILNSCFKKNYVFPTEEMFEWTFYQK
jgi:hypothetical protein